MGTQTCPEPAVPMGRLSVTLWLSYQSADRFIADCPGVGEWHSSPAGRGLRVAGGGAPGGWGRGAALPAREGLPRAQQASCCSSLCGRDPHSAAPRLSALPCLPPSGCPGLSPRVQKGAAVGRGSEGPASVAASLRRATDTPEQ